MRILALPAFKNRRENPYNAALYSAVGDFPGVKVAEFNNRQLLLEGWDIFHIHWPDTPLHRRTAMGVALYSFLFIARVYWARLLGAKIVWTVHNLHSHDSAWPRIEKWFWKAFVPLVHCCIHLSQSGRDMAIATFPGLRPKAHSVHRHGHYRGCYLDQCNRPASRLLLGIPAEAPVIAFVGQIKAYKNVAGLIRAFLDAAHPTAILLIAGRPGDSAIGAELRGVAENHPRIHFHFGLIPDDGMHFFLNACNLTVFPYRDILNSGSAILSLSFDRPTLVPARGAMAELRELAGADWVYTYEGELTGSILAAALKRATAASHMAQCDLSRLSWECIAAGTLATYRAMLGRGMPSPVIKSAPVLSTANHS